MAAFTVNQRCFYINSCLAIEIESKDSVDCNYECSELNRFVKKSSSEIAVTKSEEIKLRKIHIFRSNDMIDQCEQKFAINGVIFFIPFN